MPNPPSVRTEGDVLVLTWPDAGVRAEAEQLRRDRGDLVAAITWYVKDPTAKYPHLHGGKLKPELDPRTGGAGGRPDGAEVGGQTGEAVEGASQTHGVLLSRTSK